MKIANVTLSSMNANRRELCGWLRNRRPDIVTLQKIGKEEDFGSNALRRIGYRSEFLGRKSHSDLGVAVLTHRKLPKPEVCVRRLPGAAAEESRFLTVKIGDLRVSSVYAPYGPPPHADDSRPKSQQAINNRVKWLNRLRDYLRNCASASRHSLLCGDFNVKVKADGPLKKTGYYSAQEQDAFEGLLRIGFVDLYRKAHPCWQEMPGFTHGFSETFPQGTSRLHLVLGSAGLALRLRSACLDVQASPRPRKDSPPLVVDIDLDHI